MKNNRLSLSWILLLLGGIALQAADSRPNILWITSEDNGPELGCYGDDYATTPNLDAFASTGMMYLNAWSTAPVCAPARTTLISGLYPPSTGAQHMRSMTKLPSYMKMYPQYLRDAGYYCTNNNKKDYNLEEQGQVWDESSRRAHWRNRESGQPFFAIFNHTISHESQIRKRPHIPIHQADDAPVPAYHPNTPESRRDWAQYYDKISAMDVQAGQTLKDIEKAGLAGDTIIFYYGDHGSGMPRSKRWPYNSGLNVPLIVHVPAKYKHLAPSDYKAGGTSDRLVGFIDLPPTVLSVAGIKPPGHMQGHAFLGEYEAAPQPYAYGFRGRMDERYDMVRVVRNKRYLYIRNYMPHKIYGQYIDYMFQTPTTRVWKEMYDAGKLNPPQTYFWETKDAEELYDLENDTAEIYNLKDSPAHQTVLNELRDAHNEWALKIRDLGFLPEAEIHSRAEGGAPYNMGHDDVRYPMKKIMETAALASSLKPEVMSKLKEAFGDDDSAVRYWAAMGCVMRGSSAVNSARHQLHEALTDDSPSVRVIAAEALGRFGNKEDIAAALEVLLKSSPVDKNGIYVSMLALNAIDYMDDRAAEAKAEIGQFPGKPSPPRMEAYVPNLLKKILADFK
jgi:arylsulfatase A-like enzyme